MINKVVTLACIILFSWSVSAQDQIDYVIKAKALRGSGKADQAINLLNGLIPGSTDSRIYLERAEAHLATANYSAAIGDFNEANNLLPFSGEYGLSRIYALKGDAATALYHLERNLNSNFKKSEKEIMLNPAFGVIENKPEWRQFWKKEWFSYTERSISQIEYLLSSGRIEESKAVLDELKARYGENDDILYAEALINLSAGKYSEVNKRLNSLIITDPDNEKYLRTLAQVQTMSSNIAGASNTYTRLIDLGVADAELLLLRADCFRRTGENNKAMKDIDKYINYYPDDKEALSLAGRVAAVSGDNLKALEYFSTNLKLHPDDPECYIDRANSYFVSKSWDWAIKDYSMSLDLDPGNKDVWLNKGIALVNTGKTEDACHDFKKAYSMGNKRASEYISRYCIK